MIPQRALSTLLLLLVAGCSAFRPTPTPTAAGVGGLVGKVKPRAKKIAVGEDLMVDYWISSLHTAPVRMAVADGSSDPDQPFQGYTFNAVLVSDPKVPMDPIFVARPLLGPHTLDPQTPVRFQRIRWRPRRPGTYKLTFIVEWRKDQIIAFDPATVQVTGRRLPTEKSPIDVKPEVSDQVGKLMARMGSHLDANDWRKRAQLKMEIRKLGSSATFPLLKYLGSPRQPVRMETTSLMIEFGRQAIPALLRGCEDGNALVRYRCVFAMGKIREGLAEAKAQQSVERSVGPTMSRLAGRDPDIQVRYVCLDMLARHFSTRLAARALLGGLSDKDKEIRRACNRWLKQLSGNDVGYDPAASPDERAAGIDRWRKLWKAKLQ